MTESQQARATEQAYGPDYRADFLSMYKDYVASAERISDRRQLANTFFVTINTTLLGLHGLAGDILQTTDSATHTAWISALAGCLMCVAWMNLIAGYKRLNSAKFAVILSMEKQLPSAPFTQEWSQLKQATGARRHTSLSDSEKWVPRVFIAIYTLIILLNGLHSTLLNELIG